MKEKEGTASAWLILLKVLLRTLLWVTYGWWNTIFCFSQLHQMCVCVSFSLRQSLFVCETNPVDYPGFELTEICPFQPPASWEIKVWVTNTAWWQIFFSFLVSLDVYIFTRINPLSNIPNFMVSKQTLTIQIQFSK